MNKAQEILTLIEDATPCQKQTQVEYMQYLKSTLEQVKMGKDSLDSWTAKEGVKSLLSPEAEKLQKEIQQILNSIVGEVNT